MENLFQAKSLQTEIESVKEKITEQTKLMNKYDSLACEYYVRGFKPLIAHSLRDLYMKKYYHNDRKKTQKERTIVQLQKKMKQLKAEFEKCKSTIKDIIEIDQQADTILDSLLDD